MLFPVDPFIAAPAIGFILKTLTDEIKKTILDHLRLTVQKHKQYKSKEYKLLENVEGQIRELQTYLKDERISKLHGGLTLLRDYARTKSDRKDNSKNISLNGVLETFHQLASLPIQGITNDYPNAKICSLANLAIAAIYYEFNYSDEIVLEYVYKAVITYRPIAVEIFGAQTVSLFLNSGKNISNILPIKGKPVNYNLAFSPASDYLAIGVILDYEYDEPKGELFLFDVCYSTLKQIPKYEKHDFGGPLVFIAKSNMLAITSAKYVGIFKPEMLLGVWDMETMRMVRTQIIKTNWSHSLVCSPNGSELIYGEHFKLSCFSNITGKLLWKKDYPNGGAVAYAHNSNFIASCGSWIHIMDATKGNGLYSRQYPLNLDKNFNSWTEVKNSLAFSQDDSKLINLISWDNPVGLNDVEDRGKIRFWNITGLSTPDSKISIEQGVSIGDCENVFVLSPDGFAIISGSSKGEIHVWNMNSGELTQSIQAHKGSIHGLAISPDGTLIASGGLDRQINLWQFSPIENKIIIPG